MTRPPDHFMREALRVAGAGLDRSELPIGAVVVLGERVIAAAHTAEREQGRSLVHAELLALEVADRLRPLPGKRSDARLFTTPEPCPMCLGAAMSFGLGEIHYALESPGDGAVALARGWRRDERAMPSYRLPRVHGGTLRRESMARFKAYTARHSSGGAWERAETIAAREQAARPTAG